MTNRSSVPAGPPALPRQPPEEVIRRVWDYPANRRSLDEPISPF